MNPAIREDATSGHQVRARLRALLDGHCLAQDFIVEMQGVCERSPEAGWELLALIDQYRRRGQISPQLFRTIKSSTQWRLMGLTSPDAVREPPRPASSRRMEPATSPGIDASPRNDTATRSSGHRAPYALLWCALISVGAVLLQRTHWFPAVGTTSATTIAVAAATATAPATAAAAVRAAGTTSTSVSAANGISHEMDRLRVRPTPIGLRELSDQAQPDANRDVPATSGVPSIAPRRRLLRSRATLAPMQWSASAYTVSPGQRVAAVTVRRAAGQRGDIDFSWWTENASATAGRDFRASARQAAQLRSGAQTMTLIIPVSAAPPVDRSFYVVMEDRAANGKAPPPQRTSVHIRHRTGGAPQ